MGRAAVLSFPAATQTRERNTPWKRMAAWLRRRGAVLALISALPLFVAAAFTVQGNGPVAAVIAVASALFYCGYAVRLVRLTERRFETRETRLKSQLARRVDEFAPNEARLSRQYFETRLEQEVRRSRRHRLPLCVVTLDTPLGRERLVLTSQLIELTTWVLRAEDVAGRLGRGRYAIYLPHTTPAGAAVVIERLQRELGDAVEFGLAYLKGGRAAEPAQMIDLALKSPVEPIKYPSGAVATAA